MAANLLLDARIDHHYEKEGKSRWVFYSDLAEERSQLKHGEIAAFYEQVASRCRKNGEQVTARTVRGWIASVSIFTAAEIQKYKVLPFRLIGIACEIGEVRGIKPQDILDWCVENIGTNGGDAEAVKAVWLPDEIDEAGEVIPRQLASAWRYRVKLEGTKRKQWERCINIMKRIITKV